MIDTGNAHCGSCGMDLGFPDQDGEVNACGHCQWDEHVCPEEKSVDVLRSSIKRIREHEAQWLRCLREEVPSYDPDLNDADCVDDVRRMDEMQTDQAFDAQLLLRALMTDLEAAVA
ncbi:hypothetical protein [Streptomyces sp. ISL-11]|uniref:hypothetical protein n=1 Tax=Streptomyces sp. ISL-11 TaxID=2819174 RepID=UPI001BEC706A|nr:hypothetical protein [Streptomyces sp. ISL-11]MBT2383848.1 hypothetical protein [Streptomyces sp. ISL-11]